jgi:hypothetical protein
VPTVLVTGARSAIYSRCIRAFDNLRRRGSELNVRPPHLRYRQSQDRIRLRLEALARSRRGVKDTLDWIAENQEQVGPALFAPAS